jgi:hypothetical protein
MNVSQRKLRQIILEETSFVLRELSDIEVRGYINAIRSRKWPESIKNDFIRRLKADDLKTKLKNITTSQMNDYIAGLDHVDDITRRLADAEEARLHRLEKQAGKQQAQAGRTPQKQAGCGPKPPLPKDWRTSLKYGDPIRVKFRKWYKCKKASK